MTGMIDICDRFFAAVARGDIDAVGEFYREDAEIWHNFDNIVQSKNENLSTLAGIPTRYDSFTYVDVRATALEDGFLRQHTIKAVRKGKTALVPAILRAYVEVGRIYRIEEYFDHGQLQSALA